MATNPTPPEMRPAPAALECGQALSDQAVSQHRIELIKAHLP